MREQYDNAEGSTWKDKVNFMRREQYKVSGDKIRAQKKAAYARKHAKNEARAIDSMHVGSNEDITYSKEDYMKELQTSPVGIDTIRHIRDSKVTILIEEDYGDNGIRGWQQGDQIVLYNKSINSVRVAGQTLIHEMTHYYFDIGNCQLAEAICFAFEKMHIMKRNYLTEDEWEYVKKLAIDNYPELEWKRGGYGEYEKFDFIIKNQRKGRG